MAELHRLEGGDAYDRESAAAFQRATFAAFEDALALTVGVSTFNEACEAVGIKPLPALDEPTTWRTLQPETLEWSAYRPESRVLLAAAQEEARTGSRVTLERAMTSSRVLLSQALQEEIGTPGTRYIRGLQQTEPNTLLRPFQIRGRNGERGLNHEAWRSDPGIFRHVNEHAAITCSATYEPRNLDKLDSITRDITQRGHRAITGVRGGWRRVKRHWATSIREGFAACEPVWGRTGDGLIAPVMLEPREAASVDGWVFDENRRTIIAGDFQTFSDGPLKRYALPCGETPMTCRLLTISLNASGSEVEGVSPIRPVLALRKMKELCLQCAGIALQKFGVPIATVSLNLVDATIAELGKVGTPQHVGEIRTLVSRLKDIRSRVGPVLTVPVGVTVDYVVPNSEMPDARPLLEWIDLAIAQAFANEGALLGSGSGSYALAEAKTAGFLRSAPAYAENIADGLDRLMRVIVLANHPAPDDVEVFPEYGFRFAGSQDATRWVNDLATLQNSGIAGMSEPIQSMAAGHLGLPADAFAVMPEQGNAGAQAPTEPTPDGRSSPERTNAEVDNAAV